MKYQINSKMKFRSNTFFIVIKFMVRRKNQSLSIESRSKRIYFK